MKYYAALGLGSPQRRVPTLFRSSRFVCAFVVGAVIGSSLVYAQQGTRSVWDGVYTPEQASRGDKLYSQQCASCHGTALTGGESAPPLSGGEFSSNWNGLSLAELFERIKSTMPADRPGKISRQQTADILSYILTVNQFPTGTRELDTRNEVLQQIRMEAAKPGTTK